MRQDNKICIETFTNRCSILRKFISNNEAGQLKALESFQAVDAELNEYWPQEKFIENLLQILYKEKLISEQVFLKFNEDVFVEVFMFFVRDKIKKYVLQIIGFYSDKYTL